MQAGRLVIALDVSEVRALIRMAEAECRQPREQIRFLLRQEAVRRGLIHVEQQGNYTPLWASVQPSVCVVGNVSYPIGRCINLLIVLADLTERSCASLSDERSISTSEES